MTPQLPVRTYVWMPFRGMMSLESSGRVRWAIEAPGWVLESQYSTVIPPQRGSPYHHLSIKNLLSLQRDCGSASMDSLTN